MAEKTILRVKGPGYRIETMANMLVCHQYCLSGSDQMQSAAGVLVSCGVATEKTSAEILQALGPGGLVVDAVLVTRTCWSALLEMIEDQSLTFKRATLVLQGIDLAPKWLVRDVIELCDSERAPAFLLATADDLELVDTAIRDRLVNYIGLDESGCMCFASSTGHRLRIDSKPEPPAGAPVS